MLRPLGGLSSREGGRRRAHVSRTQVCPAYCAADTRAALQQSWRLLFLRPSSLIVRTHRCNGTHVHDEGGGAKRDESRKSRPFPCMVVPLFWSNDPARTCCAPYAPCLSLNVPMHLIFRASASDHCSVTTFRAGTGRTPPHDPCTPREALGRTVLRLDLRGHGRSGGSWDWIGTLASGNRFGAWAVEPEGHRALRP